MIKISPYQGRWPIEYEEIKKELEKKLRFLIPKDVLAIHHIGSTSVPGLSAKDVIDIQLTVQDLTLPLDQELNEIGFLSTNIKCDHGPAGLNLPSHELQKRFFKLVSRPVNLHIRKSGSFNQIYPILFRDYLRSNPMAKNAYAEVKIQLSKYFPENVEAYYDVKDPVCDIIISSALVWSEFTNWKVPVD